MVVNFANSFFESFEKMVNRERWYWKAWDFVRHDTPRFFRNIWLFRKDLYNYRWYGGHHSILPFMETAISDIAENVDQRGNEVRSSSSKKVAMMKRAAEILKHFREDNFIELAENELGKLHLRDWEFEEVPDKPGFVQIKDTESEEEKAHNSKVFARAREIEEQMWKELWVIIEGQDYSKFEEAPKEMNHDESYDHWQNQFDGSGMRGWWD
jgi:hypothetical protein